METNLLKRAINPLYHKAGTEGAHGNWGATAGSTRFQYLAARRTAMSLPQTLPSNLLVSPIPTSSL
eukprot:289607-Pelagomonas_calceolata.AAC.1